MPKDPQVSGFRRESEEVYYAGPGVTLVDDGTIAFLKDVARENERRRCRLCAHRDVGDSLHEMLIVHAQDAYVRPHKHLDKAESLHVIEGAATLVCFSEEGRPERFERLGEASSGRPFYYRMPEGVYHMLLIDSDWLVFHEAVLGPFERARTVMAPWSPEERDAEAVDRFCADLRSVSAQ